MKDARRPLEIHETSTLLARRIAADSPATPAPELSAEAWADVLSSTPMGADPATYATWHLLSRARVGANRCTP